MVPSSDRDFMEEEQTRGILSKMGVLWGVWSLRGDQQEMGQ